jgi:hypothetical protein
MYFLKIRVPEDSVLERAHFLAENGQLIDMPLYWGEGQSSGVLLFSQGC